LDGLRRVAKATMESAWFFEAQQLLTIWPGDSLHDAIRRELADDPPDSILDVCCGTGSFATVSEAPYLGIDLNPDYIARAKQKHGADPRRRFVQADVLTYPFDDKAHTTLYVNALHHFDDDSARTVLRHLRQITRHRLIVADPAPETLMPWSRLLIALDQGKFVRRGEALADLARSAGFAVQRHYTLYRGRSHSRVMVCS
jgi:SAM-dependent methyltransferase